MNKVTRIAASDRKEGDATSGMIREEAIATDGMWSGLVRTAPGSVSGWHHHGSHETTIFVEAGVARIEDGRDAVDLGEGDFCFIPPHTVHRESNPGREENRLVVVRAGTGTPTVNVEGPESDEEGGNGD